MDATLPTRRRKARPERPPDAAPSDAKERSIIASVLEDPAAALSRRPAIGWLCANAPRSFSDGLCALAAAEVHRQGPEANLISVIRALEDQIDEQGKRYLLALVTEALPLDLAEADAARLVESRRPEQLAKALKEAAGQLESIPKRWKQVIEVTTETLQSLAVEGPRSGAIEAILTGRMFSPLNRPPDPTPRFFISNTPICTPGNLTAVSATVKAGKSAFIGAMIAAVVTDDPEAVDTFGIRARNPHGHALLHLDTEQCAFDHWQLVTRALARAQCDAPPDWLLSYCLTGLDIREARSAIDSLIEKAHADFHGIFAVLIDGVADLVVDVNDSGESNTFTAHLHQQAIDFDCSVVTVIHTNPGTQKTRGHLGSQLERKSETNLRLEKADEITVVWADKNRRAPILKAHGPRFTWSVEAGMHVSTDATPGKGGRPKAFHDHELCELLPPEGLAAKDWLAVAREELGAKETAFHEARRRLQAAELVAKSAITGRWEPVRRRP